MIELTFHWERLKVSSRRSAIPPKADIADGN
jgi:hypothetical protein